MHASDALHGTLRASNGCLCKAGYVGAFCAAALVKKSIQQMQHKQPHKRRFEISIEDNIVRIKLSQVVIN